MKFLLYTHLSHVSQVYSIQVCMIYSNSIVLMSFLIGTQHAYLQCFTYVIMLYHILTSLKQMHGIASLSVNFPWLNPYHACKSRGATTIFNGSMGNFEQF